MRAAELDDGKTVAAEGGRKGSRARGDDGGGGRQCKSSSQGEGRSKLQKHKDLKVNQDDSCHRSMHSGCQPLPFAFLGDVAGISDLWSAR